jgi:hypothetical protein
VRGRRREEWRAALRTKRTRDEIAAVASLRELLHVTPFDVESVDVEADAHVERTAGYAAAVRAMAIVGGPDRTVETVSDGAA